MHSDKNIKLEGLQIIVLEHIDAIILILIIMVLLNQVMDSYKIVFNVLNVVLLQIGIIKTFIGFHEYSIHEAIMVIINTISYPAIIFFFSYSLIAISNLERKENKKLMNA